MVDWLSGSGVGNWNLKSTLNKEIKIIVTVIIHRRPNIAIYIYTCEGNQTLTG